MVPLLSCLYSNSFEILHFGMFWRTFESLSRGGLGENQTLGNNRGYIKVLGSEICGKYKLNCVCVVCVCLCLYVCSWEVMRTGEGFFRRACCIHSDYLFCRRFSAKQIIWIYSSYISHIVLYSNEKMHGQKKPQPLQLTDANGLIRKQTSLAHLESVHRKGQKYSGHVPLA